MQTIRTAVDTRGLEVHRVATALAASPEVQRVATRADPAFQREVQIIRTSGGDAAATIIGGHFSITVDTRSTGGSREVSGEIAHDAEAATVRTALARLRNVGSGNVAVTRSGPDNAGGFEWHVTFAATLGNLDLMSVDDSLTPAGTKVSVHAGQEATTIGGTFRLAFAGGVTGALAFDASAREVEDQLEALPGVSDVYVAREQGLEGDVPGGHPGSYAWIITFAGAGDAGNVMQLEADSAGLRGAVAEVRTVRDGAEISGGSFGLSYADPSGGNHTVSIAFNETSDEMQRKLGALAIFEEGSISVSRTGPSAQGTFAWMISHSGESNAGDVFALTAPAASVRLTPAGTVDAPVTVREGSTRAELKLTVPTAIAPGSEIQIEFTDPTTGSAVETGAIRISPGAGDRPCARHRDEVQEITSHTVDSSGVGGDDEVSAFTTFTLLHGGEETERIRANEDNGNCTSSAARIEGALRALGAFDERVEVRAANGQGADDEGCTWRVTFRAVGGLALLQVRAFNGAAVGENSVGGQGQHTASAGGDTIAVRRIVASELDPIAAAINALPGAVAGAVRVSAESEAADAGACAWRITFMTKAGNLADKVKLRKAGSQDAFSLNARVGGEQVALEVIEGGDTAPLGGYFALVHRGQRSAYLSHASTSFQVERALNSLGTLGSVRVTASAPDENLGRSWAVTFESSYGDVATLEVDARDLQGTGATAAVAETVKGSPPAFNSLGGQPLGTLVVADTAQGSARISSLQQGVPYFVRVRALSRVGYSAPALASPFAAAPLKTPPGPPTGVVVESTGASTVQLAFEAPSTTGGGEITEYRVEYGKAAFEDEVQIVEVRALASAESKARQTVTTSAGPAPRDEVQIVHAVQTVDTIDAMPERQSFECYASGGTFTVSLAGEATGPIAFDAAGTALKRELEALASIGEVIVDPIDVPLCDDTGRSTVITFTDVALRDADLPDLAFTTAALEGARHIVVREAQAGQAGLGGTFRLSFRGQATGDISVSADSPTLQRALRDLDTVPSEGVTVSDGVFDGAYGRPKGAEKLWHVTFTAAGVLGDVEAIAVPGAFERVTGSGAAIRVYADDDEPPADVTTARPTRGSSVGGMFTLAYRGHTTAPIPHDASESFLESALMALPSVGTVAVARGPGPEGRMDFVWTIDFTANPGAHPAYAGLAEKLTADASGLSPASSVTVAVVREGVESLSGTFRLSLGVAETASIAFDATPEELKTALESTAGIGEVRVSRADTAFGHAWHVTFGGCWERTDADPAGADVCNVRDVPLLRADDAGLVGHFGGPRTGRVLVAEGAAGTGPDGSGLSFIETISGGHSRHFSHTLTGLDAGDAYHVRVRALNGKGYGLASSPVSAVPSAVGPGRMSPVRLVRSTRTSITVAWDLPRTNGGAPVQGYELFVDDWAGGSRRRVPDVPRGATAHEVRGLEPHRKYRFSVRAFNYCNSGGDGNAACYGALSEESHFTARDPRAPLRPSAPTLDSGTNVGTASADDPEIVINWEPPVDNGGSPITRYEVIMESREGYSRTLRVELPGERRAVFRNTGEAPVMKQGEVYGFYVIAFNEAGGAERASPRSPQLSVLAAMRPGSNADPPAYALERDRVTVRDVSETTIGISWRAPEAAFEKDGASPITGHRIYRYEGVGLRSQSVADPTSPEVQKITVESAGAPSGTFTVLFGSDETADISVDASPSDVANALMNLPSVGLVRVRREEGPRTWTVTFVTELGNLPALRATSGRLVGGASIAVSTVTDGTAATLVTDFGGQPDPTSDPQVTRVQIRGLAPETRHAFRVVPVNAVGEGVPLHLSEVVYTRAGASALSTTSGSAKKIGIAGAVYEEQVITAAQGNIAFGLSFRGRRSGSSVTGMSTQALETALERDLGTGAVHVTLEAEGGSRSWTVTFIERLGDQEMLALNLDAFPDSVGAVEITEFVKGHANEVRIEPKKQSGGVLRDITAAAGKEGRDLFSVELWDEHAFDVDGTHTRLRPAQIAAYNPAVYEVQRLDVHVAETDAFRLEVVFPVARLPSGPAPRRTTSDLRVTSDAQQDADSIQEALSALPEVASVEVSVGESGVTRSFHITFTGDLGDLGECKVLAADADAHAMPSTTAEVTAGITEIQRITTFSSQALAENPGAIGGSFVIEHEGAYTGSIAFNASAADMKQALEVLPSVTQVDVARDVLPYGHQWIVTFNRDAGNLREMRAHPHSFEVQKIATAGGSPTPLSGSFKLSYGGCTTADLDHDISDDDLETALEALGSIDDVDVTSQPTNGGGTDGQKAWHVTFRSEASASHKIEADGSLLTGSGAGVFTSVTNEANKRAASSHR